MSDVVLIYPPYQGFNPNRSYSPLGLPYIASTLEKAGHSVRIVDCDMENANARKVASIVKAENPITVGITVLTHALPETREIIEQIKNNSDCEIVVGGPHVTADPAIVADLNVKYGLRGESEYSFLKLFKHVNEDTYSLKEIDGLVSHEDGRLYVKEPCFIEDLGQLPLPARHLIRTREYKSNVVFSSRGCPYSCIYCAEQCRKVRYRKPESVVDEIEGLVKSYGVRHVDFGDSVFTLNQGHVLDICNLLKERKVGWSCITRADLVDRKLLEVMKKSGCCFVSFGVESGVERVRFAGGKRISDDKIKEVYAQCREIGLRTRASILFGNPDETVEDMKKSIEFVRELKPDYALFSITQVFPGTPLFERMLSKGIASRNVWREFMLGRRVSLDYLPEGVSFEDMYGINTEAFNRFYLDEGYIKRKLGRISDFDELREAIFILLAKANVVSVRKTMDDDMHKCIE